VTRKLMVSVRFSKPINYRNGLFKPNMTSIISNAYHNHPEKKDCAYSNVSTRCFLGIMLCGYIMKILELGF
jgi:dipeptide/tripeptide permease